ncbi:hypothetical protein SETIT_3G060500v2 [Setaria italica]|uniref:Uncharacterized protein n=2 Tax=Setaria TaxID=4554 RepID=A0A368QCQ5_SETIT|nr:hypothetical protein SETIT_3G060500v2 [Setaria italica]TKW24267.1 hypothetical protein SEVIR_3G041500v2 [Setaria viridis]
MVAIHLKWLDQINAMVILREAAHQQRISLLGIGMEASPRA